MKIDIGRLNDWKKFLTREDFENNFPMLAICLHADKVSRNSSFISGLSFPHVHKWKPDEKELLQEEWETYNGEWEEWKECQQAEQEQQKEHKIKRLRERRNNAVQQTESLSATQLSKPHSMLGQQPKQAQPVPVTGQPPSESKRHREPNEHDRIRTTLATWAKRSGKCTSYAEAVTQLGIDVDTRRNHEKRGCLLDETKIETLGGHEELWQMYTTQYRKS